MGDGHSQLFERRFGKREAVPSLAGGQGAAEALSVDVLADLPQGHRPFKNAMLYWNVHISKKICCNDNYFMSKYL